MKLWTKDKDFTFIDNNMLQMVRNCPQKAFFRLTEGLVLSEHTPATYFGTIWHEAMLKLWGSWIPISPEGESKKSRTLEKPWDITRAVPVAMGYDKSMEDEAKGKTKWRLAQALEEYYHFRTEDYSYQKYAEENLTLLAEEFISYPIVPKVFYCGMIDRVVRNRETGRITIIDYKTTSWNQIMDNVWALSPQFIGYVWLVKKAFKLDADVFLLDLFQMQSKKTNKFLRREIAIPQWMLDEWEERRRKEVLSLLDSEAPYLNKPACSDYGGCPYFALCSQPPEVRRNIMDVMFTRSIWDIHGNIPIDEEGFNNFLKEGS